MTRLEPVSDIPIRLLAASESFVDESRSSWIQRLCGAHQYSMRRLNQISGIKPPLGDWDRSLGHMDWLRLLELAQLQVDTCLESICGLSTLERVYDPRRYLNYHSGRPFSRWCSSCLAEDGEPYLRWEWRLQAITRCSAHNMPLTECCPWCGGHMWVDRALLVFVGTRGSFNFTQCHSCGMSVVDRAFFDDDVNESLEIQNPLLDELLTLLRGSSRRADQQLKLDFVRYAPVINRPKNVDIEEISPESAELFWSELYVGKHIARENFTLRIDASCFRAPPTPEPNFVARPKWSRTLRDGERARLARVLLLIRSEKRIQHSGQHDPVQGDRAANVRTQPAFGWESCSDIEHGAENA